MIYMVVGFKKIQKHVYFRYTYIAVCGVSELSMQLIEAATESFFLPLPLPKVHKQMRSSQLTKHTGFPYFRCCLIAIRREEPNSYICPAGQAKVLTGLRAQVTQPPCACRPCCSC